MRDVSMYDNRNANEDTEMKAQMTADEARDNVRRMKDETPKNAMKRLLQLALGPLGNLSDDARAVYRTALTDLDVSDCVDGREE